MNEKLTKSKLILFHLKGHNRSARPSLAELIGGTQANPSGDPDGDDGKSPSVFSDDKKAIKFGWVEGVFMRCLLNIWGVMLFLRLSWVVGQAGAIEALSIITLANLVTLITSISMSAVSTNGKIEGGGIYYMLSRSLGK